MNRSRGLLVVVAGPSGVGKGSVHARVREALPDSRLSVSVTTRPPRPGEEDGVEYRFVDHDEFRRMVEQGELLEWAEYAGHLYGTPVGPVAEAIEDGAVIVLDIDVQGAVQVRERVPDALLVFLVPPDLTELERRLRARGTEDDQAVARRLERAREELAHEHEFDLVVVNDDLDRCAEEVLAGIRAARAGGDGSSA